MSEVKPIYLFRRKGLTNFSECDIVRFTELSPHKLFETKVVYEASDYDALAERYECNTAIMHARTEALSRVTAERDAALAELAALKVCQSEANSKIVAKKILNAEQVEPIVKYITDGDRQPNPSKMYRVTIEQLD